MRRWPVLVSIAVLSLLPARAQAASGHYASNGQRCTIVGTSHADVLTGTGGKDVICGLGGNDTIRGAGGNDIVDGGSGRDAIDGGSGNDRIYGGSGNDTESGGSGSDVEYGGPGGDTLRGGGSGDTLRGQDGNDDLDGQSGSDNLDGGDGTNWCTVGSGDVKSRCVYDRTVPVVGEITAVDSSVDVTSADGGVTLRVHATDDTGVTSVSISTDAGDFAVPQLVSGTMRDGWWEARGTIARYAKPGVEGVSVILVDRVARQSWRAEPTVFTVVDRTPDLHAPVVSNLRMSKSSVDARTATAKVTITAHISDDRSGVGYYELMLNSPGQYGNYGKRELDARLQRTSGDARDGDYRVDLVVPVGATSGRWNVEVDAVDRTGNVGRWVGPDMYSANANDTANGWQPLNGGRLDVTGTPADFTPPTMRDVVIDRTEIDTLPRAATVTFDVSGSDVGNGIKQVSVMVIDTTGQLQLSGYALATRSGTANEGVWRVSVTFPQGVSPGTYKVNSIMLFDRNDNDGYYETPASSSNGMWVLAPEHYRTAAGAAWDGTITVVDNPAGH